MSSLSHSLKKNVQHTLRDIKNATSKVAYKKALLTPAQELVLTNLKENGFVMLPVEDVLTAAQWKSYCDDVDAFIANNDTQKNRETYYAQGKTEGNLKDASFNKTFIIRGGETVKDFLRKTPLADFKNNTFLNPVINNYYGQPSKIIYCDYWYTLKTHNPDQNVYSQSWHCDPEGDRIVKVFIYFSDVDERSGALQYIKGTQQGGKNAAALKDIERHKSFYPSEAFIDENFAKEDIVFAKAPKGTLMICDTRGLHRGGKCLDNERILGVLEYLDKGSYAHEVV